MNESREGADSSRPPRRPGLSRPPASFRILAGALWAVGGAGWVGVAIAWNVLTGRWSFELTDIVSSQAASIGPALIAGIVGTAVSGRVWWRAPRSLRASLWFGLRHGLETALVAAVLLVGIVTVIFGSPGSSGPVGQLGSALLFFGPPFGAGGLLTGWAFWSYWSNDLPGA